MMTDELTIQAALTRFAVHGPDRVLIGGDGYAVPPSAAAYAGVVPTLVLIRDDGWMLGCDEATKYAAFKVWQGYWIAWLKTSDHPPVAHTMEDWW